MVENEFPDGVRPDFPKLDLEAIYRVAYRYTHHEPTARDIAHNVYVQMRDLQQSRARRFDRAQAFAQVVAKNAALNWRRHVRRVQDTSLESLDDASQYPQEDPTTRLNDWQDAMRLLEQLPEDRQELLLLYFFGGYTIEQIAKEVGATPNAVWKAITRTLAHLQRLVDEPSPREPRIRHFFKKGKEHK